MKKREKQIIEEIERLRGIIVPAAERKMVERSKTDTRHGVVYNTTQYYYYMQMINDTLNQIRKGREAFIFNLEQVADILRYEPAAKFDYLSDCDSIRVTL